MHRPTPLACALLAAGLFAATPIAFAQAAPQPQPLQASKVLPTVTITESPIQGQQSSSNLATGVAGSALDTPFSVISVPAEQVREQAGTTLQDVLRNVPGAQADTGFNGSHTQFFVLRGAITDSGTGSNRVLRDGVRLSNYPYLAGFVENVEVLRGPGSAVGVRSEPGGTVNIVTKQPQMRNFGSVSAGAGTANAQEMTLDLNRVLSQENELAARIIATRSAASEWRHVPDKLDGLKLGIAKSDGNRYHLRAGVEVTNQTYQPDYGLPAINGQTLHIPRDTQLAEPFGDSTTNNRVADLHADVALGARTRWAFDLTHMEAQSTSIKNTITGSPLAGQPFGTFARFSSWEPHTARRIDSVQTSLTTAHAAGAFDHKLYVGLEYYKEVLNQPTLSIPASTSPRINVFNPVFGRVTAPPAGATLAQSLTIENLESFAGSAQDQIDFGDWSIVAGLRFDQQRFLYGTTGVKQIKESRWSPKLAVLRRFGDADTVYANLSTGTSSNQVSSSSNQSLPSRRAHQAELGWKSIWQDGKLSTQLAAFRLDQVNMISADQSTPLNNFDFTVDGKARSSGIEAALSGALTERLSVSAAYAFTDAKYLQNATYGGKDVPNVARHTLNLWGQYRWNSQWKTGAGMYYQGRRFADEANTTTLDGYTRFDLLQTWSKKLDEQKSVEIQLALRNVFDKSYYVSSHLHVNRWITPGQGRNIMLTALYRY